MGYPHGEGSRGNRMTGLRFIIYIFSTLERTSVLRRQYPCMVYIYSWGAVGVARRPPGSAHRRSAQRGAFGTVPHDVQAVGWAAGRWQGVRSVRRLMREPMAGRAAIWWAAGVQRCALGRRQWSERDCQLGNRGRIARHECSSSRLGERRRRVAMVAAAEKGGDPRAAMAARSLCAGQRQGRGWNARRLRAVGLGGKRRARGTPARAVAGIGNGRSRSGRHGENGGARSVATPRRSSEWSVCDGARRGAG